MELKDYDDITVEEMQEMLEGTNFEPKASANKAEVYNHYTQYVTQVQDDVAGEAYQMPNKYLDAYDEAEEAYYAGQGHKEVEEALGKTYDAEVVAYALNMLEAYAQGFERLSEED